MKTLSLALVGLLITFTPFVSARDVPTPTKAPRPICWDFGTSVRTCVPIDKALKTFPDRIVINSSSLWKTANKDWEVRNRCDSISDPNLKILAVKYQYCELNKRGFPVAKPQIVKGY